MVDGRRVSCSLTSSPHGPFVRHDAFCALPCTHVAAWFRVRASDQERGVKPMAGGGWRVTRRIATR